VRVIAAGRASEILDLGDGRVLRRYKAGGRPDREARIMAHARAHGIAVPHVHEVRDDGLVLERIDGPTMLADVWARPWRAPRAAHTLAALHARLHAIAFEDGRLLHLDLHPENVLMAPGGPVVIDWANARGAGRRSSRRSPT
jgi:tRNA A-37 threonylcarbamoyl transferase component Bud32